MRRSVRQAAYGGRVRVFNQQYKSKICHDFLNIISEELNVQGNNNDIIEVYMDYKNKHFEIFKRDDEDQFDDYRDENVSEKEKYINEKLTQLRIHQLL